jgi:predicted enzyme related to lactoylglutathione lyase
MGERRNYTPGTFCWTDLTTTDQDAAKAFYGRLFGWDMVDFPVAGGVVYSIARIDGNDVAAISPQPEQQRDAGVPPAWNSYVAVESADRALDRAKQLGGEVHAPAFDVMDAGRMGVVQDPQGAYFLVWQAKGHHGASLVNAPGALSWNELAARDTDVGVGFYSELFGWTADPIEGSEIEYLVIKTRDGGGNGGIRPVMPPEAPSHWLVYFGAEDVEAALGRIRELGGTELVGPMAVGEAGRIAVAQDPQGAVFALYAGRFEA